ncbi:MAG: hypothetical protein DMF82_04580 [Acidobacteria bacterium]|nr:MAG: hypothetical protein DMF82_04580 [Acidobacteriota bacterium]
MIQLLPLLLLAAPDIQAQVPAPAEMRGLWVVRTALVSPASIDQVVDDAQRAGFNALFVQVRGRGDAFYRSDLVPRSDLLADQPARFDPLARLIDRARARGLQVHAWMNMLLCAGFGRILPAGHVAGLHPEWIMVPRSAARAGLAANGQELIALVARNSTPDAEGLYLSPSALEVGNHLEAVVRELLRSYPVDGLHLDFIRYPGSEYDYSRAALDGFAARFGPRGDRLELTERAPGEWASYRRDVLTALVDRLSRAARSERPRLLVSAAVTADETQALALRFQSWPEWISRGSIDAVCPMAYSADSRIFSVQIRDARERAGSSRPVWAGVGAYRLDVRGVIEKVRLARSAGAAGVVIFSHESLRPADLDRLRQGAFPPAPSTSRPEVPATLGGDRPR